MRPAPPSRREAGSFAPPSADGNRGALVGFPPNGQRCLSRGAGCVWRQRVTKRRRTGSAELAGRAGALLWQSGPPPVRRRSYTGVANAGWVADPTGDGSVIIVPPAVSLERWKLAVEY